ncbi:E3 ubiquitin-protein ligase RFWD3-like [Asterias rubens]|uniref:E3 ubiquitin-protein ligase RFWD3-like n=1 Tax=Asterias rubens TaxID=7604 RepID=UPI0014550A3A|nr:E3 ubiquitin-protein ligase RFWD3-like [Asterias rubens]XP_033638922.1 E3 ubiquitin-protein ligase RFWD3-like [Asterias rubens]XP_033638923.1 E3 ubiquitin-protein ligase RFWD3-like [Asterias rubens]
MRMASVVEQPSTGTHSEEITEYDSDSTTINNDLDEYTSDTGLEDEDTELYPRNEGRGNIPQRSGVPLSRPIELGHQPQTRALTIAEEETQLFASQPLNPLRRSNEQRTHDVGATSNHPIVQNERVAQPGLESHQPEELRPVDEPPDAVAWSLVPRSEGDENSESLLNDHPPRTSTIQSNRTTEAPSTSSQSLLHIPLPDAHSLSQSNQSQISISRDANPTNQSEPQDYEEASEVIHAPNHRNRIVLDSLDDDDERQHPATIDLSQLLSNQSETVVVLAQRPARRRIAEIVIDHDDGSDSDVVDLATDEEPMELEEIATSSRGPSSSIANLPGPSTSTNQTNITSDSKSCRDDKSDDEEAQMCIICYEVWTNSGEHRLASLKCGHLFGKSCIEKWLKSTPKCPQCNTKAKKSDIRVIFAGKSLKTLDTTERDRALEDLKKEKEVRRKAEIEMAQANLRYRLAVEEMNRLKGQLKSQEDRIRSSSSQSSSSIKPQSSTSQRIDGMNPARGQYVLDKTIQISQSGNCRVMSFDSFNNALVVSMPSPNQLFPGFGVKKVSATDHRCTQYVPIHTSVIRSLTFNGRNDGLMLTGSTDKTLKMTSLVSNTVVQTYKTEAPVWSCTWNTSDVNYVYAGLQNGSILVYDTRQTASEVHKLSLDNSRCPIVALTYVPKAADASLGCSGLLMASLGGMSFWEQTSELEFKPHLLQADGICTSLSFSNKSRHCLASFRPNKNHTMTRHVMCELKHEKGQSTSSRVVACHPVQTFYGGPTMKVLSRSTLYQSPCQSDQLFACSGDEATTSALIWDTTTGLQVQKLVINSAVLDVCPFQYNAHNLLAALTDKQVKLYSWQPSK